MPDQLERDLDREREAAYKRLERRRLKNRHRPIIRNEDVQAGEDMHFACIDCRADFTVPENYIPPRPKRCPECTKMHKRGWIAREH